MTFLKLWMTVFVKLTKGCQIYLSIQKRLMLFFGLCTQLRGALRRLAWIS